MAQELQEKVEKMYMSNAILPNTAEAVSMLIDIIDKMNINDFKSEYELMEWVVEQCEDIILILMGASEK